MAHANYIQIWLEAAGQRYDVAHAAPDWIKFVGSPRPAPGPAVLVTRMEGTDLRTELEVGEPVAESPDLIAVKMKRAIEAA